MFAQIYDCRYGSSQAFDGADGAVGKSRRIRAAVAMGGIKNWITAAGWKKQKALGAKWAGIMHCDVFVDEKIEFY